MKPLFLRTAAALGCQLHRFRTSKGDEESSNILELSGLSANNQSGGNKSNISRAAIAQGGKTEADEREERFREDLPTNRILVEMDLEQNVHGWETAEAPGHLR